MGWQVSFLGETFREDELSLADLGDLEQATGTKHFWFSEILGAETPSKAEASAMVKFLPALLARRLGCTIEDAKGKTDVLRKADIEVCYVDDLPKEYDEGFPQSADEASTPT